ncbi:ATP-dependent RNA helicase DDX24 (DEAD box protein 24) [Durusdinium trenchii]|uniref:ATP-dependent RNA helicase DDX24 (DEAD box protein 24) n=1 Tax=Durusdinium trenchii TaxID=1381693 RepID=A0ABP0LL47_9DINO
MSTQKQKRLLRRKPAVVVGTPGRIFALLGMGEEDDKCEWLREGLKNVRHLVLDEADRLVESGHFKELDKILELLYQSIDRPQQLQTFVFSATLTLDPRAQRGEEGAGKVGALMSRLKFRESRAVFTVDLTKETNQSRDEEKEDIPATPRAKLPETLEFKELVCSSDKDKEALLAVWLLRRFRWGLPLRPQGGGYASRVLAETQKTSTTPVGGRVILFVNAISYVQRLSSVLSLLLESSSANKVLARIKMSNPGNQGAPPGLSVDVLDLHSKMRQKDRLKRIERFRKLKDAVLVCTDIAARGLDVPDVSAVIHFQAPRGSEIFVHRSGRTARAGRGGQSIAFVSPSDVTHWNKVYKSIGIAKEEVEKLELFPEEISAAKEASRLAADLEKKVHQTAKQSNENNWLKKAAQEADLLLEEDDDTAEMGKQKAPHRALWGLFQQMQERLRRPPRPSGAVRLSKKQRMKVIRRGR